MMELRHYPKAPITEAIIDLRVELPDGVTVQDLEKVGVDQHAAYPTRMDRRIVIGQMQVGKQVSAAASSEPIGFVYKSTDEKQVFQARLDGFTMSRLFPYESWETFRREARRLWDVYRSVANPSKIERLAVRYINRLDLPLPIEDFKDYLKTFPEVSSDLHQGLKGFFMHLAIPQADLGSMAFINEAIIDAPRPDVVSVVLDIDIFRPADVPSEEDAIWSLFEQLRDRKNEVFEACITDEARRLFQ